MGCGYTKLLSKQHKSGTKPFDEDVMRNSHTSIPSKKTAQSQGIGLPTFLYPYWRLFFVCFMSVSWCNISFKLHNLINANALIQMLQN